MDFTSHTKPNTTHHQKHHQPSSSELISSAKLVAEATQATLRHETVDKGKVAGAAANLLDAVSHYGKLEEKSFGKHIETAENYLHKYSTTTTTTTTNNSGHSTTTTTHSASHSSGGDDNSGSGYGEYFKMAEGFLKKH